jgi:hypothetical protein
MAALQKLISLLGTVKINGQVLTSPFYQDGNNIVTVQGPVTVEDVSCFYLTCNAPRSLPATTVCLRAEEIGDLDDFASGLATVFTKASFSKYTDLVRGSNIAEGLVASGTDLLINDQATVSRTYLPDTDETLVQVVLGNALSLVNYVFAGDQTDAGQYYYFTSSGNA